MKKLTAILFALVILSASAQPCTGRVPEEARAAMPCSELTVQSAHACCSAESASPSDSSEEEEEPCSPLCGCQCCGVSFVQHLPESRSLPDAVHLWQQPEYVEQSGMDIPALIWQPPPHLS